MKLSKLENGQPEIFLSLQGEGPTLGKPSIFIRLAECNLRCSYCDSKHTWIDGVDLTLDQVVHEIKKFNCKNIVITGGEPLLQDEEVYNLIDKLPFYTFEIETNGTILPKIFYPQVIFNVSPKLENSYNQKEDREKEEVYKWHRHNESSIFKFVVDKKEDLDEVLLLIEKYNILKEKVYLMAEGIDEQILKEKEQWLTQICLDYQLNFTTRLHIKLWRNQRGK